MGKAKRRRVLRILSRESETKKLQLDMLRLASAISEPGFACITQEYESVDVRWISLTDAPLDIQQALASIDFNEARAFGTEDTKEFNVIALTLDGLLEKIDQIENELEQIKGRLERLSGGAA